MILHHSSERGFQDCQCPIGTNSMGRGCLVASNDYRIPSCVVRISTPRVLAEVRRHFACDTLEGAELENQDTGGCVIVGSHWEQRVFDGEVMVPVSGGGPPTYMSRVTLALFQDSGWYLVDFSKADVLTRGVHWGYQQGCAFATEHCISNGVAVWDRAFCTHPHETTCSLDRTQAVRCEMLSFSKPPPAVFNYLGRHRVGSLPEMDYCPSYRVQLTNRVCTDAVSSTPAPYTNVNIMREAFGPNSRCLMADLRCGVQTRFFETYHFREEDFANPLPACYHMECAGDGKSYLVKAAKEPGPGLWLMGSCTAAGQRLTASGFEGSVQCAAPEEICQVQKAGHVNARMPAEKAAARNLEILQ